jgi:DNA-binding PadR family transcriptional regulator
MIKNLLKGAILETVVLNMIECSEENGAHGYAIFRDIKKKFGVSIGPSVLYPELKRLEKNGLISPRWEIAHGKARKRYIITSSGQKALKEYSTGLRIIMPVFVRQSNSNSSELSPLAKAF